MKRSDLFQRGKNGSDLAYKKSEGSNATSILEESTKSKIEKNKAVTSESDIAPLSRHHEPATFSPDTLSNSQEINNKEVGSNVDLNSITVRQAVQSNTSAANEETKESQRLSIGEKNIQKREEDGISNPTLLRSFTRIKVLNAQHKEKQPEPDLSREASHEDFTFFSVYAQKEENLNRDQYANNQFGKSNLVSSKAADIEAQEKEEVITVSSKSRLGRVYSVQEEPSENCANASSAYSLLSEEKSNCYSSSSERRENFYEKRKYSDQRNFNTEKFFLQVEEKLFENMKVFDIVSFKTNLSFYKHTSMRKHKFSDSLRQCLAIFSEKNNAKVDGFFKEEKFRLLEKTATYEGWRLFQEKNQIELANLKFSRFVFCYSFLKFFLKTNLDVVLNHGEKYIRVSRSRGFTFLRLSLLCLLPNLFACLLYSTDFLTNDKRISRVSALAAIIFSSINILLLFHELTNYSIKPEHTITFWHKQAREFNVNSTLLVKRGLFRQEAAKLLQENPLQKNYEASYNVVDL